MKYKKLRLDFNYTCYSEWDTDIINGYKKNYINYSLGQFFIYVDADNVEYGKKKLLKAAADRYKKTISQIGNNILQINK
jgi:hypothetical protein